MTLAIMQPYIFPYLGYFQLVGAVDEFVFFDDVHFINKGWINRNQLLHQNQPAKFTIPLLKASQNKLINEIELADFTKWRKGFLKSLEINYKKAPNFKEVFTWVNDFLFSKDWLQISDLAAQSVSAVAALLELPTRFSYASSLNYKRDGIQSGALKIQDICKMMDADTYINPKNGISLYDEEEFVLLNIKLHFINMQQVSYRQFQQDTFVPHLSIIDVLMFNNIEETKQLLIQYDLN